MKKCVKVGVSSPYISKEQFCKQCHISKRTALKLIKAGLLPVTKGPTGYLIAKEDVKQYLINREREPKKYFYSSSLNSAYRGALSSKTLQAVKRFFKDKPEMLSAGDVSELFGCHPVTISKWKHDFGLNTITFQNKMYIPKQALLDFISSPQFKKLIPGETELWKLINPGRTGKRR